MNACKYLLTTMASAATMAVVGLTIAAPAFACEAGGKHHHPATAGIDEAALHIESAPADLPKALGERGPQTMRVDLDTVEATGRLEDSAATIAGLPPRRVPDPSARGRT